MGMIEKIKQGINQRDWVLQRKQKAQGLVEFALVLPVLLMLLFGVIEFGRMLFIYSAVFTSSREGARYGSAAGIIDGTPRYNDCNGIYERSKALGSLAGIRDGDISIMYDSGPGTPIFSLCPIPEGVKVIGGVHRIVVEVNTEFSSIIPILEIPTAEIRSTNSRTIMNNISVKSEIPVMPTPLPGKMYVNELIGNSSISGVDSWIANVEVTVVDFYGNLLEGVNVIGTWNQGTEIFTNCMTDSNGKCSQTSGDIPTIYSSVTFVPSTLEHPNYTTDQSPNPDPYLEIPSP